MTRELTTRGPFNPGGMTAKWMLESGVDAFPASMVLTLPREDGKTTWTRLDVHEAGDLYQALEAHMENVAAGGVRTLDPQERDRLLRKHQEGVRIRNLKAIQDEIDRPLQLRRGGVDAEFLAAMEDVVRAWTNNGPYASAEHSQRRGAVLDAFPGLAVVLDRLAALNA